MLDEEGRKLLERMHERVDRILALYKDYFDALAEYDRTGVLKIRGRVVHEKK